MARATGLAMAALIAGLSAGTLAAQQTPCQAPLRLAYLNSARILANTPGRAQAESTFNREMVGFRAEVQRLQSQLDSTISEYNRTSVVLTPAARQARETEIRNLQARAQTRAQELDQQASAREAELTAPIMQRVNAVIEGVRAEFNCAMIFDATAELRVLITADQALDLSPLIIQRLQAAAPPPAAARDTAAVVQPGGPPPVAQPGAQQAPAQRPAAPRPGQRPTQPPPAARRQ